MSQSAIVVGTGLIAISSAMRNVANNLANIHTTSFKEGQLEFGDLTYQNAKRLGVTTSDNVPNMIQLGRGVAVTSITKNFAQGDLKPHPDKPFNLAIDGLGFFAVLLPDGRTAYTRNGAFTRNNLGRIVTSDGYELDPTIEIPLEAKDITIAGNGEVFAEVPDEQEPRLLGQIMLTKFIHPAGLEAFGNNLYLQTAASGDPQEGEPSLDSYGVIKQRFLEASNVSPIHQMLSMLDLQQAHAMLINCLEGGYKAEKGLIDVKA